MKIVQLDDDVRVNRVAAFWGRRFARQHVLGTLAVKLAIAA